MLQNYSSGGFYHDLTEKSTLLISAISFILEACSGCMDKHIKKTIPALRYII